MPLFLFKTILLQDDTLQPVELLGLINLVKDNE